MTSTLEAAIAADPVRPSAAGRGRQHSDITRWVETTFPSVEAGSATVYDLSKPLGHNDSVASR